MRTHRGLLGSQLRSLSLIEKHGDMSSAFNVKNFFHAAAIRLFTSIWCGFENVIILPKYLVVSVVLRMSMSIPLIFALVGGLHRLCPLCKIFVLSGWRCSPYLAASVAMSSIILDIVVNDDAQRSTSSANLKFVSVHPAMGHSHIPYRFFIHFSFSFLIIDSETQLNNNELNGSPCLTPCRMENCRLVTSVWTTPL